MKQQNQVTRSGMSPSGVLHKSVRAIQVLFLLAVALVAMIPSVYADGNDLGQLSECHTLEQPASAPKSPLL